MSAVFHICMLHTSYSVVILACFMFSQFPIMSSHFCSVPGGSDGPSGVLVCSENYLTYKNFGEQQDLRMPIPRRKVTV
jgi:hypothetical protein